MARKTTNRKVRLEEQMLKEVNQYLRSGLNDPRISFVSVTKVELNDDLSMAKIYWDTFDNSKRGDAKSGVVSMKGRLRTHLSKVFKMRAIPDLEFIYDSQFDDERKIEELLNKAKSDES